ncbi:MAG: ATP-binding cassette domain-containing protein [Sarcina sp.]
MVALKVVNISKRFKDKLVLDNINFEVKEKEIFGLIGPNGAGKSTLLNIITGILDPSGGEVEVCGHDIDKATIKAKECIGYVMQDLALIETINAYDNLEYFGALYGLSGKLLKERINEALKIAGLEDTKKKKVNKFSGGMKRRLNMAVALMHHPKLLILDEPTVGVDAQSRNHIFDFIKSTANKWGTSILYTSHYMEEVEELCERIFIIDQGKEVASGSKNDIRDTFSKNKVVEIEAFKITNDILLEVENVDGVLKVIENKQKLVCTINDKFKMIKVLKVLEEKNIDVKNINYMEEKLEDIFLALTGNSLRD